MSGLLRAVRQQRAMTLEELATGTGLTKSYLSKVERGQSMPSIAAALKIARVLDVDVAQLFSDDPHTGLLTVDRASDRGSDRHHPIAAGLLGKSMSPFVVRPSRQFSANHRSTHPGQEFLFVHTGTVELSLDGRIVELTAGDCAYFDATVEHKLRRVGDQPAEAIVVALNAPARRAEPT